MEYETGVRLDQIIGNQEVLNKKLDALLKAASVVEEPGEEPKKKKKEKPKSEFDEDI